MKEYHKIETLFVRDMEGTKKLIEGQYRDEVVEYLKDLPWVFTEKVDGTNIRVVWDGHCVVFYGRTDGAQIPSTLVNKLNSLFMGTANEQLFEQKFGATPVTIYGEGYGSNIQAGAGLYSKDADFIVFDVEVGNIFLERENVEEIAKAFNCKVVPIVITGTIQEAVALVKTAPKSLIAQEPKEMEGVVGTPLVRIYDVQGNRIIVKVKVRDFLPTAL